MEEQETWEWAFNHFLNPKKLLSLILGVKAIFIFKDGFNPKKCSTGVVLQCKDRKSVFEAFLSLQGF